MCFSSFFFFWASGLCMWAVAVHLLALTLLGLGAFLGSDHQRYPSVYCDIPGKNTELRNHSVWEASLGWTSPGPTASQGLLSATAPGSFPAELLPNWSALRVSVSLVSVYKVKDFAFILVFMWGSCWPFPEECHLHLQSGVVCRLAVGVLYFSCRSLLKILNGRGPWADPWEALLATVPQVV